MQPKKPAASASPGSPPRTSPDPGETSPFAPPERPAEESTAPPIPPFEATQPFRGVYLVQEGVTIDRPPALAVPVAGDPQVTQALGGAGRAEAAPAEPLTLGEYRLVKKLGEGGMGTVYHGRQDAPARDVAIKVLARHLAADPIYVQRFSREARLMTRLTHPNVVRCYGVGEDKGFHYLAMEFIDGGSLQDRLRQDGRLSVGDALHVLLACAGALQHAHELGLIHRDVKPDNILLTRQGVVKVTDLGLAKAVAEDLSLTRTGTGAGTPYYMAPEQARDAKHVDQRCDIYALGCMLYCFLTGQVPFQGDNAVALIQAKEAGRFSPARRANSEVPPRLDLIIGKMLAKAPEHRHQSCAEVIEDLEGLRLANEHLSFVAPAKAAKTRTGAPAPRDETEAEERWWYVSFQSPDGDKVTRKLKEQQVLARIKAGHFDAATRASRQAKTGFRDLAAYQEFEPALRDRRTSARSEKSRSLSRQHEPKEKSLRGGKWFSGWFFTWLAVFAAVGGLAYWFVLGVLE